MMNTRAIANRYSHLLRTASDHTIASGQSWYPAARETAATLASVHGTTDWQAGAVIAALSPRVHWRRNVRMADEFMRYGDTSGLSRSTARAREAMISGIGAFNPATAPKTHAFALNLIGDDNAVTIDMWMVKAAGLPKDYRLTVGNRYAILSDIVTRLACRNNLTPAETQAIIWIAARGKAD